MSSIRTIYGQFSRTFLWTISSRRALAKSFEIYRNSNFDQLKYLSKLIKEILPVHIFVLYDDVYISRLYHLCSILKASRDMS